MVDRHALLDLLEKERAAILRGMFDGVTALAPEKERLLADLPSQDVTLRELHTISASVSRNQTLLDAAIRGVKQVNERLEVLRQSSQGFAAYSKAGERMHVGRAKTQFERKA